MKLHILGICGTFMGGIAALARELGHEVEGSDANVYPPMSTQLERLGIVLKPGYAADHLVPPPDVVRRGPVVVATIELRDGSGVVTRREARRRLAG